MKDLKWKRQLINCNKKGVWISETYSELSEISKMEFSTNIIDCIHPFTIFAKHFILGVSQGYEYVSDNAKQNPDALSLIPQKIRTAISVNFFHF